MEAGLVAEHAHAFSRREVVVAFGQGRAGFPASGGVLSRLVSGRLEAMTHKGRPAGPFSIGRALEIPSGSVNDDLRLAVEAIDRVHGVGHLPCIPMEFRNYLGTHGRFEFDGTTGEPIRIVIDRRAPYRTFVAIHEIGHFLDLASFGEGPSFGSRSNRLLSRWSMTIHESAAYYKLFTLFSKEPSIQLFERLRSDELWSRSYSQYIAIRCGQLDLLQSLDAVRAGAPMSLHNPLYWEDNDFRRIAEAIDSILLELGWRE